jgi:putative glutamine amidotransferase
MIIGITDCSKYAIYEQWIRAYSPQVQIIKLSYHLQNLSAAAQCQGVVLTGGEDVHPRFYGKPEYYPYCYADDVDEKRDEFEWQLLQYTEQHQLPVLGICRGLQFFNVFLGGTLIPDIPTWQQKATDAAATSQQRLQHTKLLNGQDSYHAINILENTQLQHLAQANTGIVNSNHHQCADNLGKNLVISAISPDGIIEALERPNSTDKPYICLVQWHPERMNNPESPLSAGIRQRFFEEVQKNSTLKIA